MNHFYIQTTIDGLTPSFQILQHTMVSMFRQGYTQTTPSFSMPNFSLTPYTPRVMAEHMQTPNSKYQAPSSTIAYTNLIPLLGSSAGLLSNHAYHNAMQYNAYGQPENDDFGYETPLQFPFRPQPIDMTLTQATVEPCADPNNITNQLATILRVLRHRT
jgi:hypothetical protein